MGSCFTILGSGSSGNCALLETGGCRVLVDAGFSCRKINGMLDRHGASLEAIDAILLTHEHADHAAGLTGLGRYPHVKVFANRATAAAIQPRLRHRVNWQIFETGTRFAYRDISVDSFSVPHDAQDPVGFVLHASNGNGDATSVAWLTDLGHAPQLVLERIRDVDVLVIESNHDLEMLERDVRRPWSVKQRIRGRHGHLSNQGALEVLSSVNGHRWRRVFLAHLSRDCNSVETVESAFADYLRPGGAFELSIVPPGEVAARCDLFTT